MKNNNRAAKKRRPGRPASGITRIAVGYSIRIDLVKKLRKHSSARDMPQGLVIETALEIFFSLENYRNVHLEAAIQHY